jgi:hypothetical protein
MYKRPTVANYPCKSHKLEMATYESPLNPTSKHRIFLPSQEHPTLRPRSLPQPHHIPTPPKKQGKIQEKKKKASVADTLGETDLTSEKKKEKKKDQGQAQTSASHSQNAIQASTH